MEWDKIKTEERNERTANIDALPTIDMIRLINDEDKKVAAAVEREAEHIAAAVDVIAEQLRRGAAGPCLKTRLLFHGMRLMFKHVWRDSPDAGWWREHGWLDRKRPWKKRLPPWGEPMNPACSP